MEYLNKSKGCSRTYATLCIYHNVANPQEVTNILSIEPDRIQKIGDYIRRGKKADISCWFLGTKKTIKSKDVGKHIEWILKKLNDKKQEINELKKAKYTINIWCFWESAFGNGGPIIDHRLIKKLSDFPINLLFDVYFVENDQ